MLELEGVVKHFRTAGEEVHAINGVSLCVHQGEMAALHGPSGSGKTTLMLLIAGLLSPEAGVIRFAGREISSLPAALAARYLYRDVGFVYQNPALMPRVSALENAAMKLVVGGVPMREAQARARPWLERVGLEHGLARTPEQLSSGERQRVSIARALAGDPRLILADEPTGNLDSARSLDVVRLLSAVAHERDAAVLLVTHDLEAASVADRRLMLRDGRVLDLAERVARADGKTPEVLGMPSPRPGQPSPRPAQPPRFAS